MITNNAKKIFLVYGQNNSSITGTNVDNVITGDFFPVAQYPGLALGCGAGADTSGIKYIPAGKGTLDVGFGDTAETASDYKLADGNIQNPRLSRIALGKNAYSTGDILNIYANFRNDGATSVVVKEIGYYANPCDRTRTGSDHSNTCLLFRKVLENPVTIAPGETYTFSYNVRFRN